MARECHAALEDFQGLIERQIAALEALDQALELGERLFEVRRFAVARQVSLVRERQGEVAGRATLHSAPRQGQRQG